MISKFEGRCGTCGGPIHKGDEIHYDGKAHHIECRTAKEDCQPDSRAIANELGYVDHHTLMAADRPLLLLSRARGGATAGRIEPETQGLFDSVQTVPAGIEGKEVNG